MHAPAFTTAWLTAGGLRVFVRAGGPDDPADAPVVCVHGAVISGRYMLPLARRLATRRRVYVPDLPGYGRSETPPDPLRVPGLADALRAFLDAAGIPRAHLIGNSLGTQIIAEVAARMPERTASLVLVGPTVDRAARTRRHTLWRLFRDAFRERWSLIPLHVADTLRAGPRFALASLDVALEDRIEDKLPAVEAPTLVVSGTHDPLVPPAWSAWLAGRARHARLEYLEGPHALNYSRPDQLASLVEAFIGEVERREG